MSEDRTPREAAATNSAQASETVLTCSRHDPFLLGRYRVIEEIGVGGMATVHLARVDGPGGFHKWVAIKQIHRHLAEDEAFVRMFLDEARVAARISHPNVAQVFELGQTGDSYWIAMEYLHGEPLRELVRGLDEQRRPALPPPLAARLVAEAAEGLHAAHELRDDEGRPLNLVHRDVSPHNVFVTYDGSVKVVDFGIAKGEGRLASTRTGTLKGKLAYMSPEQARGGAVDRRTDVFALGVVLWELLTGRRLFCGGTDIDTLARVQACRVPRPSSLLPDFPLELEAIVMQALARRREQRHVTARALSRSLRRYLMFAGAYVGYEEVGAHVRSALASRLLSRERLLRIARGAGWAVGSEGRSDGGAALPHQPEAACFARLVPGHGFSGSRIRPAPPSGSEPRPATAPSFGAAPNGVTIPVTHRRPEVIGSVSGPALAGGRFYTMQAECWPIDSDEAPTRILPRVARRFTGGRELGVRLDPGATVGGPVGDRPRRTPGSGQEGERPDCDSPRRHGSPASARAPAEGSTRAKQVSAASRSGSGCGMDGCFATRGGPIRLFAAGAAAVAVGLLLVAAL